MLIPYANRIGGAKYTWNGTEYHLPINDVAGLNNSLHGLLWNRTMAVDKVFNDTGSAGVQLSYEFNDPSDPSTTAVHLGYPFHLRVSITYLLSANGQFSVEVQAENTDVKGGWPLPFFNGWHPYFLCHPCKDASIVLDQNVNPDPNGEQWRHVDVGIGPQYPPPRHSNMVPTTHTSSWHKSNGTSPIGPATDPDSPPGAPLFVPVIRSDCTDIALFMCTSLSVACAVCV